MVRLLEELTFNALPALQTHFYDGWVLRFANGYSRRANSVQPLYPSILDVNQKIDYCETQYQEHGLSTIFKLTGTEQPPDLEVALIQRGYVIDGHTALQTRPLTGETLDVNQAGIEMEEYVTEDWLSSLQCLSNVDDRHLPTIMAILESLDVEAGFFRLMVDGEVAAMGLGVLERGYVGLYDIVTDAERRQRGYGRLMVLNILRWAQEKGAHSAYLQVMLNNRPALSLYHKLGFREVYQYWYRQQV
jgi:ribosomal protein S18 acetylase RimI-like enzyme